MLDQLPAGQQNENTLTADNWCPWKNFPASAHVSTWRIICFRPFMQFCLCLFYSVVPLGDNFGNMRKKWTKFCISNTWLLLFSIFMRFAVAKIMYGVIKKNVWIQRPEVLLILIELAGQFSFPGQTFSLFDFAKNHQSWCYLYSGNLFGTENSVV